MMSTVTFSVRIPPELDTELQKRSKEQNTTRNQLVNVAIKQYLQHTAQERIDQVYAPILEQLMRNTLQSFENRIATGIYKTELEVSMILTVVAEMLAQQTGHTAHDVKQLVRKAVIEERKKTNKEVNRE